MYIYIYIYVLYVSVVACRWLIRYEYSHAWLSVFTLAPDFHTNWVKRWLPLARKFGLRVGTRQEQLANSRMEPAILGPMQEQQLPAAENEALSKKGPERENEGGRQRKNNKQGKGPKTV